MPFPRINHVLMAEVIKPESDGKISMLGFLGVCPDVAIKVKDATRQLRLTFLLLGEEGIYPLANVSFDLIDASGRFVLKGASLPNQPTPPAHPTKAYLVADLRATFGAPGVFALRMSVDGVEHHKARFELSQA